MPFDYFCAFVFLTNLFFHHIGSTPQQFPDTSMNQHHLPAACLPLRPLLFLSASRSLQTEAPAWNNCDRERHKLLSVLLFHSSLCIAYPCFFHSPLPPSSSHCGLPSHHGSMHCFLSPPSTYFYPGGNFKLNSLKEENTAAKELSKMTNKTEFCKNIFFFQTHLMLFIHFYVFSSNTQMISLGKIRIHKDII